MGKFCGKCGSPLDPNTGLCPNCGGKTTGKPAAENHRKDQRRSSKGNGGLIALILILLLMAGTLLTTGLYLLGFIDLPSVCDIISCTKNYCSKKDLPQPSETEWRRFPQETMSTQAVVLPTETVESIPEADFEPEDGGLKIGDTLIFGRYPQYDGVSGISWTVLDVQEDMALLISQKGLDSKRYHFENSDITWEKSSLRTWLNTSFYRGAFNDWEREQILQVENVTEDNPQYGTWGGNSTMDRVFVLSLSETEKYMPSEWDRCSEATAYAQSEGAFDNGNCWWILRTPGEASDKVVSTNADGSLDYEGGAVASPRGTIRPALWMKVG